MWEEIEGIGVYSRAGNFIEIQQLLSDVLSQTRAQRPHLEREKGLVSNINNEMLQRANL